MISGEVRESAHPTMMANGCWVCAVAARLAATGWLALTLLWANRSFPAFKRLRASSAGTDGAAGSAAIAQPLKARDVNKMRLRRLGFMIEKEIAKAVQKQAMLSERNFFRMSRLENQEAGPGLVGVNEGTISWERFRSAQCC